LCSKVKRLCMDCADSFGFSPTCLRDELLKQASPRQTFANGPNPSQVGPRGDPFFVLKNTFVSSPRSQSAERRFNRPTTSFPL
jgi:hypothetical protein